MVLFVKEDVWYRSIMCAVECKCVEKKARNKLDGMTVWYSQTLSPCLDFRWNHQLFSCPAIIYIEHSIELCFVNGSWASRPYLISFLVVSVVSMPAVIIALITSGWLSLLRIKCGECQAYVAVIVPIGHGCAAIVVPFQWYGWNGQNTRRNIVGRLDCGQRLTLVGTIIGCRCQRRLRLVRWEWSGDERLIRSGFSSHHGSLVFQTPAHPACNIGCFHQIYCAPRGVWPYFKIML